MAIRAEKSKYNLKDFNDSVKYYEQKLAKFKGKTLFVVFDQKNEKAFFSIAPMSRAAHNIGCDMNVQLIEEQHDSVDVLLDVWTAYEEMVDGISTPGSKALKEFITFIDKKGKGKFKRIFFPPEAVIYAGSSEFEVNEDFSMKFCDGWFKKYKWSELLATGKIIWEQVFDIKKNESASIGFDLIARAEDMKYPLEDYLDSYAITRTIFLTCPSIRKIMKANSSRKSVLDTPERTTELFSTLLGCELDKDIDEPVFKIFKKLSSELNIKRLKPQTVIFFAKGEGYSGKHLFGEVFGYPTPNKKSRWETPSQMVCQFAWYPQTKIDDRMPLSRVAFTDTLPIDIFIESCKIDWLKMNRVNNKLKLLINSSDRIFVESKNTNLEVGLIKKDGSRRIPLNSDIDTREMIDKDFIEEMNAGNMGNIPGGEVFTTPEYVEGTFHGDCVINIDKSYVLSAKDPLVIKCNGENYEIVKGPKLVVDKIKEKTNEAMKGLLKQEKNKSLPKEIIEMKKRNFKGIGEFAINTNPKAKLCDYLIVNEKIAGMIHIALGSGFENDKSGLYHYDIVIDAKSQKLDIYGVSGNGKKLKKHWMMRKGKLVI